MLNEKPWDGRPITAPGIYTGVDMSAYHGQDIADGPSVSSSGLRTIWGQSEAHFWANSPMNPNRIPEDDKPHFALGRLAHQLLLEGRANFDKQYAVRPEKWVDWRTNAAQEWRDAMVEAGFTIITQADLEVVTGMARSLAAHPLVRAGILDGAVERSLLCRDEQTGVWLKSRPDVIPKHALDLADLKSCVSVSDDAVAKSMDAFGYHMQAALAGRALKAVADLEMASFNFVWVEKTAPHCVRVTAAASEDLVRGSMQIDAALAKFSTSMATGVWPGPGGDQRDAITVGLPTYARQRIDRELERLKGDQQPGGAQASADGPKGN